MRTDPEIISDKKRTNR